MGASCSAPKVLGDTGGLPPDRPHAPAKRPGLPGVPSQRGERSTESAEPPLPIHVSTFSIRRRKRGQAQNSTPTGATASVPATASTATPPFDGWRRWYSPGRELGRGISATVCEAEAMAKTVSQSEKSPALAGFCGQTGFVSGCYSEKGRRVAVKRFKKIGSRSYHTELLALLRVGVHPNILRLLESYEDCDGEDVLVLEYCDGSTVFEAYAQARKNGDLLPELLVARLIRQLLLALEHILSCGIEHQDVKPENMLLHSFSISEQRAELKLADFGWATATTTTSTSGGTRVTVEAPPAEGAGSLWYAPPELNPPVQSPDGTKPAAVPGMVRPAGRSDMWSVGVVVYLMLVGHNPFNAALKKKNAKAVEEEVISLVSRGECDTSSTRWLELPQDARDFILAMLVVEPSKRLPASEALRHSYLVRRLARCSEAAPPEPAWRWADREDAWSQLDGFQRLAWAAVSRSVSEPELSREAVAVATRALGASRGAARGSGADTAYVWHLARELSASSVHNWLADACSWAEVLRLAFRYLDNDDDGVLSPKDLVTHLVAPAADAAAHEDAWSAAHVWVYRWERSHGSVTSPGRNTSTSTGGLTPTNFRAALLASTKGDVSRNLGDTIDGIDQFSDEGDDRAVAPSGIPTGREEEELCWGDMWREN